MKVNDNDISSNKDKLGQFFTEPDIIKKYMKGIDLNEFDLIVEPSFGSGNFLDFFKSKKLPADLIGVELCELNYKEIEGVKTYNENFYDWNFDHSIYKKIAYIGNPPYRTPAYSLSTHKEYVKKLCKNNDIIGIKEEAIIFFIQTYENLKNIDNFEIIYILPKVIFQNDSKFYKSFSNFLYKNLNLLSVQNLNKGDFKGVSQDLVLVRFRKGKQQDNILIDGKESNIFDFYGISEEYFKYTEIFNKGFASLGSVPMESLFFSLKDEPLDNFMTRLKNLFFTDEVEENMMWHNKYHLQVLNSDDKIKKEKKLEQIKSYIKDIKEKKLVSVNDITNKNNFKSIKNRKNNIYYFRLDSLKKVDGVYILNPNPGKSFYFTCNPTKTSTDYYGYCDYDVNRNSSPGGIRTILVDSINDCLTPSFTKFITSKGLEKKDIFDLIEFTYNSNWYKMMKKKYTRFYFGIPKDINIKEFKAYKIKKMKEKEEDELFDEF